MATMMTRNRFFLFGCVLLVLVVLSGLGPSSRAMAATNYTDDAHRFAFAVPESWMQTTPSGAGIATAYTATDPIGFFLVGVYPAIPGASLDDSMALTINQTAKMVTNYTFVQSQATTLSGEPARLVIFTGENGGVPYDGAQEIVLHGGSAYVLTFGVLPGDVDAFKAQIAVPLTTWQFL